MSNSENHAASVEGIELSEIGHDAEDLENGSADDHEPPSRRRLDTMDSPRKAVYLSDEKRYLKASIFVTNAMRGRLTTTDNPELYFFFHGKVWYWTYIVAVLLLCSLIIFENPTTVWIYLVPQDEPYIVNPLGALREDGTAGASVPVPLSIALNCVEIGLCVVFFFDYVMRKKIFYSGAKHGYYKYTAKERKTKNRKTFDPKEKDMDLAYLPINVEGGDPLITDLWTNFELILACIVTANALACLITTSIYWMQVIPNVGRLLRPFFFLVKMVNVRQIGTSIVRSIPKILDVVILLVLTILMFAIVAFLMFSGVTGRTSLSQTSIFDEPTNDTCAFSEGYHSDVNATEFDSFVPYCSTWSTYCRDYFNSVAHAFIHLFILVTTANFPDIMNPYTECNGWAFVFFAAYIVLSLYTFLSLVLAVVYNLYQRIASAQIARRRAKAQRSIWKAYELLSEPVDKAVVADAHVKLARTHLRGKGMSMAKITDDSHSHQLYKLGDLVDRGVVHYHKRYRVHNWVQWLRARVTSIYTNDDGEQTHVDVEYVLGNGKGRLALISSDGPTLSTESQVPVSHLRYARGVSLKSWLKLKSQKNLRRESAKWCTQLEVAVFSMIHDACRPEVEQPDDLRSIPEDVRRASVYARSGRGLLRSTVSRIAELDDTEVSESLDLNDYDMDGDKKIKKKGLFGGSAAASIYHSPHDDFEIGQQGVAWDTKAHDFVPDDYVDDYLIDLSQFEHLVSFSETSLCPVDSHKRPPQIKHKCYHRTRMLLLSKVVATNVFAIVVDMVILAYAVMLVIEYARIVVSTWLNDVQTAFLWFFLAEICIVMYARTIRGYFFYLDKPNSPLNMLNLLDAIAIFASVFMDQEYFVNSNDSAGLSFVSLFRVIRMVRVLRSLKRFQVIFRTLKHLLPALARYVLLVFLIFYVFAVIGMELFGNLLINNENSTTYLYVSQSSFGTNFFWGQNFDSFGNAVLVLFAQMVVNNWPVVMEGCIAAYNAVYYHNMNATSREYAYFYDLTHTNGCASAFYDASWLPYNQTWVYDEPCLGSLDGSGVKHECSGVFTELEAAQYICANYGIQTCSGTVRVGDHWEHRFSNQHLEFVTNQMEAELELDVSSTEALIALENEIIADSTGNIIRSDEDVASVDVWLMTCIANDFYFSVQGQTAADLFINFFVRLYFVIFYFLCVLTVLNVIIAVFLDFYNVEQDRHRALVEESSVPWRKFLNYKVKQITGVDITQWIIHKAQHSSGLSIFSTTAEFPFFAHLYEVADREYKAAEEDVGSSRTTINEPSSRKAGGSYGGSDRNSASSSDDDALDGKQPLMVEQRCSASDFISMSTEAET